MYEIPLLGNLFFSYNTTSWMKLTFLVAGDKFMPKKYLREPAILVHAQKGLKDLKTAQN